MSLAGGVYLIIMKTITVSGAIILRESNGIKEIFATQRGYGDWLPADEQILPAIEKLIAD